MKDKFEFYKEFYFKELNRRNEINSSLTIPIGLITALIGGVSYLLTNFEYHCRVWLTIPFVMATSTGVMFLICAVFNLIKAYTNFPGHYDYILIADIDVLESYYQSLQKYYASDPGLYDNADKDFEEYIITEMVRNTGANQRTNNRKTKFSYNCEKYLICSLIAISISLPFFSIDYGIKPDKKPIVNVRILPPEGVGNTK